MEFSFKSKNVVKTKRTFIPRLKLLPFYGKCLKLRNIFDDASHSLIKHSTHDAKEIMSERRSEILKKSPKKSAPHKKSSYNPIRSDHPRAKGSYEDIPSDSQTRGSQEYTRGSQEHTHESQEYTRGSQEHTRGSQEQTRGSREQTRGSREHTRGSREHTRGSREHTRGSREHTRGSREHTRKSREHTRGSREQTRGSQERTRESQERDVRESQEYDARESYEYDTRESQERESFELDRERKDRRSVEYEPEEDEEDEDYEEDEGKPFTRLRRDSSTPQVNPSDILKFLRTKPEITTDTSRKQKETKKESTPKKRAVALTTSDSEKIRQNRSYKLRYEFMRKKGTLPSSMQHHMDKFKKPPFKRVWKPGMCFDNITDRLQKMADAEKKKKPQVNDESSRKIE